MLQISVEKRQNEYMLTFGIHYFYLRVSRETAEKVANDIVNTARERTRKLLLEGENITAEDFVKKYDGSLNLDGFNKYRFTKFVEAAFHEYGRNILYQLTGIDPIELASNVEDVEKRLYRLESRNW